MEGKADHQRLAYEEFEPLCKWQRKDHVDIIEIHLKEFKKDQLKIQISNCGILKVWGECPLYASTKSKFYKEIPVPDNIYDASAIRAKFINGYLFITMPKQNTRPNELDEHASGSAKDLKIDRSPKCEFRLAKVTVAAAAIVVALVAYVVCTFRSTVCDVSDREDLPDFKGL